MPRVRPRPRVAVIGAGIGGLAAAARLASLNYAVTVCEAHAQPGGKMREITVDGRAIDSGPTVFTMRWVFDRLFNDCGETLDAHLTLHRSDLLARHRWLDGSQLDLFTDTARSADAIATFAGTHAADAYRRFTREAARIFDTLEQPFMSRSRPGPLTLSARVGPLGIIDLIRTKPFISLWSELGRQFDDPRLRQLFARYATYCGSNPLLAPATLMLIADAEKRGVWMVDGGMQRLAEALQRLAESRGAEFHYSEPVDHIETEDGLVAAIHLASGRRLETDAVVFNGDTRALTEGKLGSDVQRAVPTPKPMRSLSAITLSTTADVSEFPLAHHTVLFGDDYPSEFEAIFGSSKVALSPTIYLCAQDRGVAAQKRTKGAERLFMLMNAPARRLTAHDRDSFTTTMQRQLARHGLQLADDARGRAVRTSPNDFAQMFPSTSGALYGRPTHGWVGSFQRPGSRTAIPNLFCAGGSVHPGAGIPMVATSGRLAAEAVARHFETRA